MSTNRLLVLCCLGGLLFAAPAHAQLGMAGGGSTPSRLVNAPKTAPSQAPAQPPPAAIPGVRTAPTAIAPAERPTADMSPNDALFDAINRGDTAAARDALNRGAELDAHNILGMTPLELSVDIGRDDITFILLSMRGAEPSRRPPTQEAAAPPKPGRAARVTASAVAVRPPARDNSQPAPTPAQFANSTGTPQPNAGFLGFGPR